MAATLVTRAIDPVNTQIQRPALIEPPKSCATQCKVATNAIISTASEVRGNIGNGVRVVKMGIAAISGLSPVCNNSALTNLSGKLANYEDTTDAFQLFEDANYMFSRRTVRDANGNPVLDANGEVERSSEYVQDWKNAPAKAIGRTALAGANMGSAGLFMSATGVTSKLEDKFAGFANFMRVGLVQIVRGLVAFGFAALAIDAIIRLVKAEGTKEKVSAALDLAWSVAEVALKVFVIAGAATLIGGIAGIIIGAALAFIAAGLGLAAAIYKMVAEKQARDEAKRLNIAAAA